MPGFPDFALLWSKWFVVMLAPVFIVGRILWPIHWSVALSSMYLMLSSIMVAFWKPATVFAYSPESLGDVLIKAIHSQQVLLSLYTLAAVFAVWMIVSAVLVLKWTRIACDFMEVFCVFNAFLVLGQLIGGYAPGGFLGNPSMNACMIAILSPYAMQRRHSFLWGEVADLYDKTVWSAVFALACLLAPVAAVLFTGEALPVAALVAAWAVGIGIDLPNFYRRHRGVTITALTITAFAAVTACTAIALHFPEFIADNGRFGMWAIIWEQITQKPWNFIFGKGAGTYPVYAAVFQDMYNFAIGRFWFTLHNDLLQGLFSLGVVGATLFGVTLACAFKRAYEWRRLIPLQAGVAYLVTMAANFPTHAGLHAVVGALILTNCFRSFDVDGQ